MSEPALVSAMRGRKKFEQAQRAAMRAQRGAVLVGKLRALEIPGVSGTYTREWPDGYERGATGAAAAANGKVYDPDGILDRDGIGHEMFHLLDQQLSASHADQWTADRARLQRLLGKRVRAGAWDQGTGATAGGLLSPSEVAADMYSALVNKRDPRHGWSGGYSDGGIPSRRELLRFGRELERIGKRYGLGAYTGPSRG